MKKKPASIKNRIFHAILPIVLCLAMIWPVSAQSRSTVLTTQIPAEMSIQIIITGEGTVCIAGQVVGTNQTVRFLDNEKIEIYFFSSEGYQLKKAVLNDTDISEEIYQGKYILKKPQKDSVLAVIYEKESNVSDSNPVTGDTHDSAMILWVNSMAMSLLGLTAVLRNRKRFYR